MLFFPVGETDITTSTLFPQFLQRRAEFLASALAETSVFDFAFPDIMYSSFPSFQYSQKTTQIYFSIDHAHIISQSVSSLNLLLRGLQSGNSAG